MAESGIPTIDIEPFLTSITLGERQNAARKLAEAVHVHGAVGVVGWEQLVPDTKLKDAFQMAQRMFDLPMEDKMKAPHPDGFVPHRGYSAPGKEKAYNKDELATDSAEVKESQRKITDYKEHYEIGSEENKVHYNIWLPEDVLPGYKQYETDLFWFLHGVSVVFMEALLLGLGVSNDEANKFKGIHSGHDSILRLLHYPPIDEDKIDREYLARCPAHQDLTQVQKRTVSIKPANGLRTFTILFQDEAGGLEFEDTANKGNFLHAVPKHGKLYLNTGDMFEIFSNGYYPSAMHRVTIPRNQNKDAKVTAARQSMPFFIIPANDAPIHPATTGLPGQQEKGKFTGKSWNEQAAFITKWQYEKDK